METPEDVPLETQAIADILERVGVPGSIRAIESRDDWRGPTAVISLEAGRRVLLVLGPDDGGAIQKEARLTERVRRETPVPVCPVLGVDPTGAIADVPVLVLEDPGGLPVFDIAGLTPARQRDLFEWYGRILGQLQAVQYRSFGLIDAAGDGCVDGSRTWRDWVLPRLDAGMAALAASPLSDAVDAAREIVDSARGDLTGPFEARLVKGSYAFEELLVDPDRDPLVCAVRGYERALAGPAEYQYVVARWRLCERSFRSPSFRDAFDAGYHEQAEPSTGPPAERRKRLYRLEQLLREVRATVGDPDTPEELTEADRDRFDSLEELLEDLLASQSSNSTT